MTRILALLAALIFSTAFTSSAVEADSADNLRAAVTEMRRDNWTEALRVAGERGSVTRDIVVWHWLRAGKGSSGDVLVFLDRRPDWPGLDWLRRKSEPSFTNADPDRVLQFYDGNPPKTAEGALNFAAALLAKGNEGDAHAELVKAWRTMPMGSGLQSEYLKKYRKLLAPHHEARLDRLLWDGHKVSGRRMVPLVSDGHRKLAEARLALQDLAPGVDDRIAAVPAGLKTSPGLAHDRFVWRDRKGFDDSAVELMLSRSKSPEALGEPQAWAQRRRNLARQKMRDGDSQTAYKIAAHHHLTPEAGYAFADLEWIAGFVALRKLDDPATAVQHFERFETAVASPISKGRAGYWIGRAYEAMGDIDKAQAGYALAAEFQTSYYGLLAAERIGRPFDPKLMQPRQPDSWKTESFMGSTVLQAGLLLLEASELDLAERFLTHLVEGLQPEPAQRLGDMVLDMNQPHLAVMIAKRAARTGVVIPNAYFPLHPLAKMDLPMAPEMSLAIARRESEFDPVVISGAGARGLMQVMPATAKLVATDLGILGGHSTDRLIGDWKYNAKLGANYLAGLAGDFRGNVVMMSAGYNAGPRRPISWMQRFGDPRSSGSEGGMDIVDWIEHIPFNETRNYVMRVTESLPIYRARLEKKPLPVPFSQELTGSTLYSFAP
ncbi:lytic transglycosylase domain-containing protein [Primorskyibacter sp. S87]|uniref:lytic transglycosylase domain-containing protein n=1 Tax=Primorskyibacter sp. S87 TaxID=3415126 RepID=UPI003C7C9183